MLPNMPLGALLLLTFSLTARSAAIPTGTSPHIAIIDGPGFPLKLPPLLVPHPSGDGIAIIRIGSDALNDDANKSSDEELPEHIPNAVGDFGVTPYSERSRIADSEIFHRASNTTRARKIPPTMTQASRSLNQRWRRGHPRCR